MTNGLSDCSAFQEDETFGTITVSFLYRWSVSRISVPEYKLEDILKAVLHALDSPKVADTPFLVVLIFSIWEDTPWNSAVIRGHHNMSTLIRIPGGHMRFVPVHKQSDEASHVLCPAKWPVEFVLIANAKGRDPTNPRPGNPSYLPPHARTNTFLPDPTLPEGPVQGSPDPTPTETSPRTANDAHLGASARPGHTA